MTTTKSYTPQSGSIADRMLNTISTLNTYLNGREITDLTNLDGNKKHINDAQASQALFTLSTKDVIRRKKLPGKKKRYVFAPKEMKMVTLPVTTLPITPTEEEIEKPLSNEMLVTKFVTNTIHKNAELRDLIQDHMLDTPLTYLINEAKLTETDIQDLLK